MPIHGNKLNFLAKFILIITQEQYLYKNKRKKWSSVHDKKLNSPKLPRKIRKQYGLYFKLVRNHNTFSYYGKIQWLDGVAFFLLWIYTEASDHFPKQASWEDPNSEWHSFFFVLINTKLEKLCSHKYDIGICTNMGVAPSASSLYSGICTLFYLNKRDLALISSTPRQPSTS